MFSANPRQVPSARLLSRLDYEEAQEIATTGAKVLHPRCINPVREARVPLAIRDTNHPQLAGTEIGAGTVDAAPSIKAISSRTGITLISMESIGMWQQVGFLADVFEFFKRHGLSIDLVGTSETNVTVSLDPTENLVNTDVLSALCTDLAKICRVKVIAPCAAITLVGRGMRSMLHRLSGILAEFGPLRVHLISQSSNNLNLTFVVDEEVAADLVPTLHTMLIQAEAMRVEDAAVFGPSWRELYGKSQSAQDSAWWIARRRIARACGGHTPYACTTRLPCVRAQSLRAAITCVDRWFMQSRRTRFRRAATRVQRASRSWVRFARRTPTGEGHCRCGVRARCLRPISRRVPNTWPVSRAVRSSQSTTCIRWRTGARTFAEKS
jgi:diaminopimelate decarboxylase/aspartate kinase